MTGSSPGSELPQAIVIGAANSALPIIHALARRGVRVAALTAPQQDWVARSRVVDGVRLGPLPEDRESWIGALGGLAAGHGPGVLISGSDQATELLVEGRAQIPASLKSFESASSMHLTLMDKAALHDLAARAGVRVPWTLVLNSAADIERARQRATYPCVVKPVFSHRWRPLFGEHRVLFASGPDDLARLALPGLEAGLELVVSEYVPGPERNLENAVILRRADGTHALAYGLRRLRQYPPGFGASALTESAPVPETMALGTALLDAADFEGFASIQTKRDARTGEAVLIEVNVRIPQHFGLGDASGVDASWRVYSALAGRPLPPQPTQRMGVRSVVLTLEPRAAWMQLRSGGSLGSVLASYRGVRDISGMKASDPMPALVVIWRQLKLIGRFLSRRSRGPSDPKPAELESAPAPGRVRSREMLPQAILVGPGGLTLVQRLARRGVSIAVITSPTRRWIARTRYAEGFVAGPLPDESGQWLETLEELARRGEGVLICGSDEAAALVAAERAEISSRLVSFESETSGHLALMDKSSLYTLADSVGVRTPWTITVSSPSELESVAEQATYPCIAKPAFSHLWRELFGEHRVLLVEDPANLEPLVRPALEAGLEMLVSEYVPGPDTNLENAVLLRRDDGGLALAFGIRKLRQYPPGFGAGSLHESAELPETMELAVGLLEAARFTGLATVETKVDSETGERVLMEVNAKLTQPFGLGDVAGLDASWRLYATLAGIPTAAQPRPVLGVRNVVPTLEPRAAWVHLREGGSVRSLLGSYRGVRDFTGMSLRDPAPTATVIWHQLRLWSRFLRAAAGRRPSPHGRGG